MTDLIIYISGPMTGLPEFNYPAFNEAEKRLNEAGGFTVLNPASRGGAGTKSYDWFIRQDIKLLAEADAIALLPGWEKSRGATLETYIGTFLEMEVRTLEDWINRKEPK